MVAPSVASAPTRENPLNAPSLRLLAELQSAHHELLACVMLMERVTAPAAPDLVQLTSARLKISQASLARRIVWRRIQDFLLCKVRDADGATLRNLTQRDLEQFRRSTEHVGKWTGVAAIADWPGYQAASRLIRGRIVECVRAEQTFLYPLLYRYR